MRPAKASPFGRGVCAADGEGKPGTKEHLHSDKHWLLIESSYRCVFVLSQRPCPLRRSAPAPPKGEPLACRSGFPSYNLSVSLRSTAPLVGEPLAKPFTLRGLPKPPLGRGGGSASALTERLSPAATLTQAACPLSLTPFASSPRGGALGRPGHFRLTA